MTLFDLLFFCVWIPLVIGVLVFRAKRGHLFEWHSFDTLEDLSNLPGDWKTERAIAAVEAADRAPQEGALAVVEATPEADGALSPIDGAGPAAVSEPKEP